MTLRLCLTVTFITLMTAGFSHAGSKHEYSPKYLDDVHKTFEGYGCVRCHDISGKELTFTSSGDEAMGKGYGCIGLQTIIVTAAKKSMAGPGIRTAKTAFDGQQCAACHDIDGKGKQRQNLTGLGVEMDKKHLGCVNMLTAITAEKERDK